ncbi:MAG: hypothetical protein Q9182_001051 [Xanthomendoza sp. 2 TL-2023]
MPEGLPEGLVTTNVHVKGNLESVDRVDVEDIARLWKAYHTNRAIFAEDVGRRLENFFWRIWGNDRLLYNITGTLVAAIFSKISEGGYIRTTPTQSPRSSRSLGTFPRPQEAGSTNISSNLAPNSSLSNVQNLPSHDDAGDAEETETESTVSSKKRLPHRPPPILKKPKSASPPERAQNLDWVIQPDPRSAMAKFTEKSSPSGSSLDPAASTVTFLCEDELRPPGRSGKTARFRTDEVSPSNLLASTATANLDNVAPELQGKAKPQPSRRKATVVANTAASRRRPIIRQRSSQSSSSSASTTDPSQSVGREPQGGRARTSLNPSTGSYPSPISKQQAQHHTEMNSDPQVAAELAYSDPTKSNRGFETDLKLRPGSRTIPGHTSFTSLPSILKKSSAAAASASYQATGTMNMGHRPPGSASDGKSTKLSSSHTLDDGSRPEVTGNIQPLPRTKSQLTMLLQRDRIPSRDQ